MDSEYTVVQWISQFESFSGAFSRVVKTRLCGFGKLIRAGMRSQKPLLKLKDL